MIDIERAAPDPGTVELYSLVRELRDVIRSEIQEARNILVMASGYENLDTVLGMIGMLEPALGAGLTVSNPETRAAVKLAYAALEAAKPNAVEESGAQAAILQLEAALFTVLNMSYEDGKAQEALENAVTAAKFGLDLSQGLLDAGAAALDGQWLSPSGQKLDDGNLEKLRDIFRSLVPVAAVPEDGPAGNQETGAGSDG